MLKTKILTILYILFFLSLNSNIYAADPEPKETKSEITPEKKVEETATNDGKTDTNNEEESSSPDKAEEDEEPDCD